MLKIAWHKIYAHPLPEGHRFPMAKYDLLPEQLIYEGTISSSSLFAPEPIPEPVITCTHTPEYWAKLKSLSLSRLEERRTGFPLSQELVMRERIIMQGTIDAVDFAFADGISFNIAGGTHHAFTNKGEGFCLLNDIALGANHVLGQKPASKILIVDLDVHQGNGTAQIFRNEPRVFTFSMHGAYNYPLQKERSDLDVPLPDKTDDAAYLKLLHSHLPELLDKLEPDFVFYQAGVDVLATDKLGRLGLSTQGCKARDRFVLESCHRDNVPLCVSMGGGYSQKIADIVEAHANTYRLAQHIYF